MANPFVQEISSELAGNNNYPWQRERSGRAKSNPRLQAMPWGQDHLSGLS